MTYLSIVIETLNNKVMKTLANKIESADQVRIKSDLETLIVAVPVKGVFMVTHKPSSTTSEWELKDILAWVAEKKEVIIEEMDHTVNKWVAI